MTPEEQFTKFENSIHALLSMQAHHDAAIRDLITVSRTLAGSQQQTDANLVVLAENMGTLVRKVDALTDKVDTLSDVVRQHEGKIEALRDLARHTEAKLKALIDTADAHEGKIDALIDTVDRIIRRGEQPS